MCVKCPTCGLVADVGEAGDERHAALYTCRNGKCGLFGKMFHAERGGISHTICGECRTSKRVSPEGSLPDPAIAGRS